MLLMRMFLSLSQPLLLYIKASRLIDNDLPLSFTNTQQPGAQVSRVQIETYLTGNGRTATNIKMLKCVLHDLYCSLTHQYMI